MNRRAMVWAWTGSFVVLAGFAAGCNEEAVGAAGDVAGGDSADAVVPSGELVDELRAQKMITVAAGDNVVRLLPPLIVTDAEIDDAVQRIERACRALAAKHERSSTPGGAG